MRNRLLFPFVVVGLTLGVSAAPACLNDTSVRAGEDEFRSRYEPAVAKDAPESGNQVGSSAVNLWGVAALAAGSGLIAGSSIIGMRRRNRERP
jgi:hypothetical protein